MNLGYIFFFYLHQGFKMLKSWLKTCLTIGETVCIEWPKQTILACFAIQKRIFLFPIRCILKLYETFAKPPLDFLFRIYAKYKREPPTPVELLTGEKNPSQERIFQSARAIRLAAFRRIRNENVRNNARNSAMLNYRKQLEDWERENEKKIQEAYRINVEEKELIRAIATALKYLKALKSKRDEMDACYNQKLKNMIHNGTLSSDKLLAMSQKVKQLDEAFKERRESCFNLLWKNNLVQESPNVDFSEHLPHNCKSSGETTVHKVLSLIADENITLKNHLANTCAKLNEILTLSENIKEDVVGMSNKLDSESVLQDELLRLRQKLDEKQELLRKVGEDRDQLKYKLLVLDNMITEEEDFLRDSESSGFVSNDYSSFTDEFTDIDETPLID